MRNPIVSGSTDLWQRVWMFYSERSGGSGSGRMSAGLQMGHSVRRCSERPSTCPSKVEKKIPSAPREKQAGIFCCYFLFFNYVYFCLPCAAANYATDWNWLSTGRAETRPGEGGRRWNLEWKMKKKKQVAKMVPRYGVAQLVVCNPLWGHGFIGSFPKPFFLKKKIFKKCKFLISNF